MRSIPQVVLAFIFVWPFGIGPLAGILAIGIPFYRPAHLENCSPR